MPEESEPSPTAEAETAMTKVVGMIREADTCSGEWDAIDERDLTDGDTICFDEPDFIPTAMGERRVIIRRRAEII